MPVDQQTSAAVRGMLAERTGTSAADWHLVLKARYGMEVVFRELAASREPGEVVTQIFTCATAVDPIITGRLRPVYSEVAPESVALDPAGLQLTDRTRAVVLQHTFGIVDEARSRRLRAAADRVGALLVEDSAHCVGRMARTADGDPLADVSVHSFGAEKVLPTRFGGAIWVNPALPDDLLAERIAGHLQVLPTPGRRIDLTSRAYRSQVRVFNRLPARMAAAARSTLTRARLFEPPISAEETRAGLDYEPMAPTPWMVRQIAEQLPRLDQVQRGRAAAVAEYLDELGDVVTVPASIDRAQPLVRFPFFVPDFVDADDVVRAVTDAGFYAGRWYRPALFPGTTEPAAYGYSPGDPALAVSEDLIARVVNLPTTVDPAGARRAADVVRRALSAGGALRI
ncbi:DegT/DnrJ/EryC1/StrS family aminotransferase [Flexivirga meconopsidis]|uniref:DegT/DnrJ/EryC1/StrS family aminotransferase n=1 Tax=Flexivirga meconopsidis TaxID=2977121 RepID=UPI00223F7A21|nr:DegT/DnrJ/EryC1/StrS family aminotransferase [Flexivirga meconopsidis]